MKLQDLFEKVNEVKNIVDRADLIAILDALEVKKTEINFANCFINAVAESLKIMTKLDITGTQLQKAVAKNKLVKNQYLDSYKVHPNDLTSDFLYVKKNDKIINLKLTHKLLNSTAAIKSSISAGVPAILSVRWNKAYYYPAGYFRNSDWDDKSKLNRYEAQGASKEMIEKAKNGIISYPSDEFIEKHKGENDNITHAILCVGYDAGEKAFIVRDFLSNASRFKGFFKIEEKCFFDPLLKSKKISMVDAAIAVEVEEINDVVLDAKPIFEFYLNTLKKSGYEIIKHKIKNKKLEFKIKNTMKMPGTFHRDEKEDWLDDRKMNVRNIIFSLKRDDQKFKQLMHVNGLQDIEFEFESDLSGSIFDASVTLKD